MNPVTANLFPPGLNDHPDGLTYRRDHLPAEQQIELLGAIEAAPWRTDLRRRVQQYGWRYDYHARRIGRQDELGPLPDWLAPLTTGLADEGWFTAPPDQAIVNEYEPGQGIAAHVDCEPCFGDTIASVSLGSLCVMDFCERSSGRKTSVLLEPGSLLVMSGSARYAWTHGIAARKSDPIDGTRRKRERRVSITFRTVRLTAP